MGLTNLIVVSLFRYQKLEEERVEKEHQLHMERIALENDHRRGEEREHEMNMLRMIMGPQPLSSLPNVHSQYLQPSAIPYDEASTGELEGNNRLYYPL